MAITTTDGSMFNKQMNIITHCPISRTGNYKVPNTVKVIGIQAFSACSYLTSIELPNNLQQIEILAFENCKQLQSIIIPSSVRTIGYNAFLKCVSLKSVTVLHEKPLEWDEKLEIFNNVDFSNCILYVPHGSKAAYAKASVWSVFAKIIEVERMQPVKNWLQAQNSQKRPLFSKSLTKLSLSRLNIFL
jgi:hypothetical protein